MPNIDDISDVELNQGSGGSKVATDPYTKTSGTLVEIPVSELVTGDPERPIVSSTNPLPVICSRSDELLHKILEQLVELNLRLR